MDDPSSRRLAARSTTRPDERFASLRQRLVRDLSWELDTEAASERQGGRPTGLSSLG